MLDWLSSFLGIILSFFYKALKYIKLSLELTLFDCWNLKLLHFIYYLSFTRKLFWNVQRIPISFYHLWYVFINFIVNSDKLVFDIFWNDKAMLFLLILKQWNVYSFSFRITCNSRCLYLVLEKLIKQLRLGGKNLLLRFCKILILHS